MILFNPHPHRSWLSTLACFNMRLKLVTFVLVLDGKQSPTLLRLTVFSKASLTHFP